MQLGEEKTNFDMIEIYFDLEQASESSNGENFIDEDIPGFDPITGRKKDPFTTWLTKALGKEHESGGNGPFVFPHSSSVFMGFDDEAEKQRLEATEAKPAKLPKLPVIHTPELPDYDPQIDSFGVITQGALTYTNTQYSSCAYNPQIQNIGVAQPTPPIYAPIQPGWNCNTQAQWVEPIVSGLPPAVQTQPNLYYPSFGFQPPSNIHIPFYSQQQNWIYPPQFPWSQAAIAPIYPNG
ncbi:hypothetical protein F5Y07DRAFT_405301 [Xylaria sp. FL0933]|nr:hypothetical protein F5Y07DRAFT_405301 [Xylaria sp. FL0933]